jgi:hypothetical protein
MHMNKMQGYERFAVRETYAVRPGSVKAPPIT